MYDRILDKLDVIEAKLDSYSERLVRVEEGVRVNREDIHGARGWIRALLLLLLSGIGSVAALVVKRFIQS